MEVGDQVQRFQVLARLGIGGMGTVFRAHDPQLERVVAIKLMTRPTGMPALLSENETVDLRTDAPASADDLLREARMMARLSHPNVLPVYEVGLFDGSVFVVMEHIDGCDLREWLAVPRTNTEIIDVFAQAARGLAAAHEHGIIHRDIKPDNVLIGRDGRVRVADFGLSRLVVRPHHSMRRLDDETQGTPRYMAPELWRGDPATCESDVFAFCVTLAEAFGAERDDMLETKLRERDVQPQLREIIMRGIVDDPTFRPTLPVIVDALSGRSRIRPRWVVAGVLGAFAVVGGLALAFVSDPASTCEVAPATSWNGSRRALVSGVLHARRDGAVIADKVVRTLDETQHAIDDKWQSTCAMRASHTLTAAQARSRQSCLERRQFELDAHIDQFLREPNVAVGHVYERSRIAEVLDCDSGTARPIGGDPAVVRAVYNRFARASEEPGGATELLAIAREASALGDLELEARATFIAGERTAEADHVSEGDELLKRAYGIALELRVIDLQAKILIRRSRNASRAGDSRGAISLAKIAQDLVENQTTSMATRARLFAALAFSAFERGEYQQALDQVAKGLEAIDKDGHRLPSVEVQLRETRLNALKYIEGHQDEALQVAHDNVKWARLNVGERSVEYAVTLNLLAFVLLDRGDKAGALEYATKGIVAASAALPASSARLVGQRLDYALALEVNGKLEEAHRELLAVFAAAEHNEAVRRNKLPLATFRLGKTLCALDRCEEGVTHLERAVELGTSQYGADHQYTQAYRWQLLTTLLDLERVSDAERTYAALERNYLVHRDDNQRRIITLRGLHGVAVTLLRGDAREAEVLARKQLAEWDKLQGESNVRAGIMTSLGDALVAQKRWGQAREQFIEALKLGKDTPGIEETFSANVELRLAQIDYVQGRKQLAVERAKRAQAVLGKHPVRGEAKRQLDLILR
jgi:eukaryotic-like serine/threonine-protein kinase